jgi:hypothetical protein
MNCLAAKTQPSEWIDVKVPRFSAKKDKKEQEIKAEKCGKSNLERAV